MYAPDFIEAGERLNLPPDTAALAIQALERVTGDESEWSELWQEVSDGPADVFAMVGRLREVLARWGTRSTAADPPHPPTASTAGQPATTWTPS